MTQKRPWSTDEFPDLPGYVSVAEAAEILGVHKLTVMAYIYDHKYFPTVYRIGPSTRKMIVLVKDEVADLKARRESELSRGSSLNGFRRDDSPRIQEVRREWRSRVVTWAHKVSWDGPIHPTGSLSKDLVDAYGAAYPEDPWPEYR